MAIYNSWTVCRSGVYTTHGWLVGVLYMVHWQCVYCISVVYIPMAQQCCIYNTESSVVYTTYTPCTTPPHSTQHTDHLYTVIIILIISWFVLCLFFSFVLILFFSIQHRIAQDRDDYVTVVCNVLVMFVRCSMFVRDIFVTGPTMGVALGAQAALPGANM